MKLITTKKGKLSLMNMLFIAIPISFLLIIIAIVAFLWAVKKNQFENLDYEASRILFDDTKKNK